VIGAPHSSLATCVKLTNINHEGNAIRIEGNPIITAQSLPRLNCLGRRNASLYSASAPEEGDLKNRPRVYAVYRDIPSCRWFALAASWQDDKHLRLTWVKTFVMLNPAIHQLTIWPSVRSPPILSNIGNAIAAQDLSAIAASAKEGGFFGGRRGPFQR